MDMLVLYPPTYLRLHWQLIKLLDIISNVNTVFIFCHNYICSIFLCSFYRASLYNLFQMKPTRCTPLLSIFISTSVHVSGNYVSIIRKTYYIYATLFFSLCKGGCLRQTDYICSICTKNQDIFKLYVALSKLCQAIRHTVRVSVSIQQPMSPLFCLNYKVLFCA